MRLLLIFILSLFLSLFSTAAVIYVDADATPGGDGSSWASAYNFLQDALDQTVEAQGDQLWIAEGTYYPDDGANVTEGDRAASFTLKDGVALYGGFVGTETSLAERDWETYVTTLSGKIFTEQTYWSIHVCKLTVSDNYYASVSVSFDGLSVIGGNANGSGTGENSSGAVYTDTSYYNNYYYHQVTANNCIFSDNSAGQGGVTSGGTWTVSNSSFSDNSAVYGGVTSGGGTWTVSNSSFSRNSGSQTGGVASDGTWTVSNSSFSDNSAAQGGVTFGCTWTVSNSSFYGNSGSNFGGVDNYGTWIVSNSSFSGNTAKHGGLASSCAWTVSNSIFDATNDSQYGGGVLHDMERFSNTTDSSPSPSSPRAKNIIAGGLAAINMNGAGVPDLGTGYVIDADPLFVDPSDPDGVDDTWGTADDGLRLQLSSPAIGEGNIDLLPLDILDVDNDGVTEEAVPLDLAGFLRVQDDSLDLGAYEYGESSEQLFTLITAASAGGSVSPVGAQNYSDGNSLTLTATASAGYLFSNWTGTADELTNPLSVTINQNRTITAIFSADTNDNDGDGLTNYQEIVIYGSNPELEDSSGDELTDKEVVDAGFDPTVSYATITGLVPGILDSNSNGLSDAFEAAPDAEALNGLSYYYDSNGNGLTDTFEAAPNAASLNSLGFYDESAMIALNLPNPLMALTGPSNEVELEFTIETTEDLQNWSVNERIPRTLQGGVGKYFLRIQTGAPYVQPTVLIHEHPTLGDILTDANGQVYYFFLYDSAGGTPVANSSWPVATAAETPVADVGVTAALDVNGDKLTINNFPVYTYVGDTQTNQASGHNLGSVWFTIHPNGELNF